MASGTVRVYEVLYNCDGPGPMGDGMAVYRTRSKADAERFAAGKRCYSGPAEADGNDVPRRLAQRWGLA